jgi:phosphoribosyl-ATP pyrophosphohydrolase
MAKAVKKKAATSPSVSNNRVAGKSRKPTRKTDVAEAAIAPQAVSEREHSDISLVEPAIPQANPEVLNRLWAIIDNRKHADPSASHSARLLAKGTPQVVQKLGEELIECLIEAMAGNHTGLVAESADVLYHLLITWVNAGIHPEEVWAELTQRERVSHLTEGAEVPVKRLLSHMHVGTTKIP